MNFTEIIVSEMIHYNRGIFSKSLLRRSKNKKTNYGISQHSPSCTYLNPVDFQLLEWILLVLGLSVPLAAPHGQDVLEVLGVIDAVAGGEHHLGGDQRGPAQVDLHILILKN